MSHVVNLGVATTFDEAFAKAAMLRNRKVTGPKAESATILENATGIVWEIETGLLTPISVTKESGAAGITFGVSEGKITVSIASAITPGTSLSAVAQAVQADGAGVVVPVTLTVNDNSQIEFIEANAGLIIVSAPNMALPFVTAVSAATVEVNNA